MQFGRLIASKAFDRAIALVVALLSLVTYLVTLSPGPYPGASARLVVGYTGLVPPLSPVYPLWSAAARLVGLMPVGSLAGRCNALSAVCGATCVGLMYLVVVGALAQFVEKGNRTVSRVWVAIRLAGVSAALFLAFCAPFWIASTRAHTATFDAVLLLGVTWLLLAFVAHRRFWILHLFAFGYGLGMVESATFISLAPLYVVMVLLMLHGLEALRGRVVLTLGASAIGGLLLYFVVALVFYRSPSYELYGYESYFRIVWYMWVNQYRLLMHSLPRVGWMVILLLTIVPWLVAVIVARRGLNEENDWSLCLLHVIMTALVVVVILNLKFSPWDLAGPQRQLVSPYVLIASLVGYLAAYWFLLPSQWRLEPEQRRLMKLRAVLGPALACPLVTLLVIAPFLNAAKADARDARPINAYAAAVLENAAGYEWLVTDGLLDDHLRILAHDKASNLEFLNLRLGSDGRYMRYITERIGKPRLKGLAQVGLSVLLQEWMETTPGIEKELCVFGPFGLWHDVDLKAVPSGPVFFGRSSLDGVDGEALLKNARDLGDHVVPALREVQESDRVGFLAHRLLRYTGLVANNTGVILQDVNREDDAFGAYALARRIDESNASALLNQAAMVEGGFENGESDAVREAVEAIKKDGRRYDIWRLSHAHGTVRTPEAMAQLGVAMALSGRKDAAVRELSRALEETQGNSAVLQETLAAVYLHGGKRQEGERLYREILAQDPNNTQALENMARLAMQRSALEEAETYVERAQKAGLPGESVAAATAAILLLRGDEPIARGMLDEAINKYPGSVRLLTMRAGLADSMGDKILFSQCLNRIRSLPGGAGHAALVAGESALKKGDVDTARRQFERALTAHIADERVLRALVQLDLRERKPDLAERHARSLLAVNPRDALAFYMLGSIQLDRGDFDMAEASLRSSIRQKKTPLALNDLSWLMARKGKFEEAETLAREAVAVGDKVSSFWDTLGVALLRTGKYEEAEGALRKALGLGTTSPATDLHMAELQILRGNPEEARSFLRKAENAQQRLSHEDREQLDVIRRRLRKLASSPR